MKTIWTSFYGAAARLPSDLPQVSISLGVPRFWSPPDKVRRKEPLLAPDRPLLDRAKKDPDFDWKAAYRTRFEPTLEEAFERLPDGAVLLCWEADWNECHQKVVFEMFAAAGFDMNGGEFPAGPGGKKKKTPPGFAQLPLI